MSTAQKPGAAALAGDARRERGIFVVLALPAMVMVTLAALLPILWILRQSFMTTTGEVTLANYQKLASSTLTWNALATTMQLSLGTLAICLVLGLPLCLALASAPAKVANRLMILIMLPLWTSILVRTYAWLVLLRRDGLINRALLDSGLIDQPLELVYNMTGTLIGMVHCMLPLFILPVYAAMRDIDRNLINASASMGGGLWRTLRSVVFPLSFGGIMSGSIVVVVYTLGFFIVPAILGGGKVNPIATRIERSLSTLQDWGGASSLGIMLCLLVATLAAALIGIMRITKMGVASHA